MFVQKRVFLFSSLKNFWATISYTYICNLWACNIGVCVWERRNEVAQTDAYRFTLLFFYTCNFGKKRKNHFSLLFSDFRFWRKNWYFFLLKHEKKCTFVEFSMKMKTLFCIVNLHWVTAKYVSVRGRHTGLPIWKDLIRPVRPDQ